MLKEGARVIILDNSHSYDGTFAGKTGTIVRPGYRTANDEFVIGVKIDGKINFSSSYKAFWFAPDELKELDNNNTLLEETIMFGNYVRAGIRFLNNYKYAQSDIEYQYALYDENIGVGDTVVVKTANHGFALATVATVSDEGLDLVKKGREIVAKVDFTAFTERHDRIEKMAVIKAKLDKKVKELQNFAVYEMLAEKDEDLKQMLSEYKDLLCK